MVNKTLVVEGIKCINCSKRIENVLKDIKEVKDVSINLESRKVSVILKKEIDINILKNKIENLDFKVVEIK